jgi:hypothetical protein
LIKYAAKNGLFHKNHPKNLSESFVGKSLIA